nr:hypothetical protein [uncultured Sphingomonas sp.]
MLHLYDRATMARALTLGLEPRLHALLVERIASLNTKYGDLTDYTEFLVVEPEDTEADIIGHIGFSPLVDPISGARHGEPGFQPGWDRLEKHDGWFEMIVTFGSTFAYILFIADEDGVRRDLLALCSASKHDDT